MEKKLTTRFSSTGWIKKIDYSVDDKLNYVFGNNYVIEDDSLYCGEAIKISCKNNSKINMTILKSTIWEFDIETLFKIRNNLKRR